MSGDAGWPRGMFMAELFNRVTPLGQLVRAEGRGRQSTNPNNQDMLYITCNRDVGQRHAPGP